MKGTKSISDPTRQQDPVVRFRTVDGATFHGTLSRLTHYQVVFEVFDPTVPLRHSEVLGGLEIILQGQTAYSGKATITKLVHTGATIIVEAGLEDCWQDLSSLGEIRGKQLRERFAQFIGEWQKLYRIDNDYKVKIADLQTYLEDLRLWLEQLDCQIGSVPKERRGEVETEILNEIAPQIVELLDGLFDRFEEVSNRVPPEFLQAHHVYARRQLHKLTLSSPFASRTFFKPLGYAGDYEMVNMIARNTCGGPSLFAKALDTWFLKQPPAEAHRNRIQFLFEKLRAESIRHAAGGQRCRVYNLGCGPAWEIQEYVRTIPARMDVEFTLVDFNDETLQRVNAVLSGLKAQYGGTAMFHFEKKSVNQLLKEAVRGTDGGGPAYELVYCAGLFDYFPDAICHQVLNVLYSKVVPGGMLLATNIAKCNPRRQGMQAILDWHLVYRDSRQMKAIKPRTADPDFTEVIGDMSGVNIYLEIRKPNFK